VSAGVICGPGLNEWVSGKPSETCESSEIGKIGLLENGSDPLKAADKSINRLPGGFTELSIASEAAKHFDSVAVGE
jgi:hypothetical protein